MRTREIIERVVWALLFGAAILSSVSAKAWDVEMHDGQWRLSVTPCGGLSHINGKFSHRAEAVTGDSPEERDVDAQH